MAHVYDTLRQKDDLRNWNSRKSHHMNCSRDIYSVVGPVSRSVYTMCYIAYDISALSLSSGRKMQKCIPCINALGIIAIFLEQIKDTVKTKEVFCS